MTGSMIATLWAAFTVPSIGTAEPSVTAAPTYTVPTPLAAPTVIPSLTVPAPAESSVVDYGEPEAQPTTAPVIEVETVDAPEAVVEETVEAVVEETSEVPIARETESTGGILSAARSYIGDGIPYVWGGKNLSGMDCSGFVWNVLKDSGYDVPYRNSVALKNWVNYVTPREARAGDLVFFPGHVGIYAGNGMLIDASSSTGTITERAVWSGSSYGRIP